MDVTLKEKNIWNSIKKFWIDGLSLPSSQVFFGKIVITPDNNLGKWISVATSDLELGHVSSIFMTIYMFSTGDDEADDLLELRDEVMELLYPGSIDLYDTSQNPWVKEIGMKVYPFTESEISRTVSRANMKYIPVLLKWGAVWS